MSHSDWIAVAALVIGGVTVPIGLALFALWLSSRTKHKQNLERFNQLIYDRKYHPPHSHTEFSGPLSVAGIKISPLKINGND